MHKRSVIFVVVGVCFFNIACDGNKKENEKSVRLIEDPDPSPAVGEDPFPVGKFSTKCKKSTLTKPTISVKIAKDSFKGPASDSRQRAVQEFEIYGKVEVKDGFFRMPGLSKTETRFGGKEVFNISLGSVESVADGEMKARLALQSGKGVLRKQVSTFAPGIPFCDNATQTSDEYDATDLSFREHAALTSAVYLSKSNLFYFPFLSDARYLSLFNKNAQFQDIGLHVLQETHVDYNYLVKETQNSKPVKYIHRKALADNLGFDEEITSAKGKLSVSRRFYVYPHSAQWVESFSDRGSFWKNPFAVSHEFGHQLFSEGVMGDLTQEIVQISLVDSLFSLRQLAFQLPFQLSKLKRDSDLHSLQNLMRNEHRIDFSNESRGEVKSLEVQQRNFYSAQPLEESGELNRQELLRRVAFIQRALNEALADFSAAAVVGSYSGTRIACIGPDRDPRISEFGLGTSKTSAKKIPSEIQLQLISGNDFSWNKQRDPHAEVSKLAEHECYSMGVTLDSPYTLASILAHWIDRSFLHASGFSFADFPDAKLRGELVLDAMNALKAPWKKWIQMQRMGYEKLELADFTKGVPDEVLLTLSENMSLEKSVLSLTNEIFNEENAASWVSRHRSRMLEENVVGLKKKVCQDAVELGLVRGSGC
jgi:hypothetical protein